MTSISGRGFLILLILAFLGLMVGIDGLLQGQWLRSLAGWAWFGAWGYIIVRGVPDFVFPRRWRERIAGDLSTAMRPTGSWPLVVACALLALAFAAGALGALVVPIEDAVLWNKGLGRLMQQIDRAIGEWGARLAIAALLGFCAFAAGKTAYVRLVDTGVLKNKRPAG